MIHTVALLPLVAAVSAHVDLSPRLRDWRDELAAAGVRVLFARVYTDPERNLLILPPDAPERPLFAGMLAQTAFVEQFVHAHALTANLRDTSIVFLNMHRAGEWQGHEEALLAHELVHIALKTRGYDSIRAQGLAACQTIHATNIVQHVLVRRELRAREIDEVPFRVRALELLRAAAASAQETPPTACDNARRLETWVDAALGLTDEQWPHRPEFLALLRKKWPQLAEPAARLMERLERADLSDQKVYEASLAAAAATLRQLE
jgi:hypothetical protein